MIVDHVIYYKSASYVLETVDCSLDCHGQATEKYGVFLLWFGTILLLFLKKRKKKSMHCSF